MESLTQDRTGTSGAGRGALEIPAAVVFYALFYLAFFGRSLASPNLIAPSDSLDFGLASFLSKQHVWTGAMYSGYPIGADPQSLMWYPLFRLFNSLGWGWDLFMISPYFLASVTCFLFVRRLSGHVWGAVFAGLVYGFSGTLLAHVSHFNQIHVAAWVPLLPHGILLIRTGREKAGILVGSLGLGLMVLAGHPQLMVYTVYLAGLYVLYHALVDDVPARKRLRVALLAAAAVALGFGLAAIQLVPAEELSSFGSRIEARWDVFVSKSMPPVQLLTLLFPLGFGGFHTAGKTYVEWFGDSSPGEMTGYFGFMPLLLAVFGVRRTGRLRTETWFWVAAGILAILMALGDATPLARMAFHLPLYGTFRVPARHFFVVAFCFAVASGLVFSAVLSDRRLWFVVRRSMTYGAIIGAVCLGVFLLATPQARSLLVESRPYLTWGFVFPAVMLVTVIVIAWMCERYVRQAAVFGVVLISIHAANMFAVHYVYPGYHLEYADVDAKKITLAPRMAALRDEVRAAGERLLAADGSGNKFLLPNLTRAWEVPAVSGSGSMGMERYRESLRMGGPGDVDPTTLGPTHRVLDLLAVKYALVPERWPIAKERALDPERWTVVDRVIWSKDDPGTAYMIARNNRALPSAWLVPDALVLSADAVRDAVRSGRLPDHRSFEPAQVALVETPVGAAGLHDTMPAAECGTVTVHRPTDEVREYSIDGNVPCYLVMSEVFYPWWQASINGVPAPLARTDYSIMGLWVPGGRSKVRIEIVPRTLYAGAGITIVSACAWLILLAAAVRSRRGARRSNRQHAPICSP